MAKIDKNQSAPIDFPPTEGRSILFLLWTINTIVVPTVVRKYKFYYIPNLSASQQCLCILQCMR